MKTAKPHFWQGEWIGDAELERRLAELPRWIEPVLTRELDLEALLSAAHALGEKLRSGALTELKTPLLEQGMPEADATAGLAEVGEFLRRETLERKLKRELGSTNPFLAARALREDEIFEAWAPLGLLVHVSPQNAFTVGPMSVLEGLLSGNLNFLKTGGSESLFPQLFLEALCDCDPTRTLRDFVIAARISSKKKDLLEKVFSHADGIAAWGGEESIQSIRKMAPPSARVVEWGHKISFVYLTKEFLRDDSVFDQIARECCALEQQACASPQCLYVETSDWKALEAAAERLGEALNRVSPSFPKVEPADDEAAEITMVTECHRLEAAIGKARVIEGSTWRIFVDQRPALAASPLFRSIWVKPLPRKEILPTLRPMRQYLQTVGLRCGMQDAFELTRVLLAAGAIRVRRIGEMLGSYAGEPHDGTYALQRYCRKISIQLEPSARGIASFDELRKLPPPAWGKIPPVTHKEDFQTQPSDVAKAQLFFKSGGSTGEPKLSTYSYDQYHEHTRLGGEAICAAGFDPLKDRVMNLLYAGGLYGGFPSFFSALETIEAVHFPMAANPDFEMVAETIAKNRVNTIITMPSYALQLFDHASGILGKYRGIEKIFYGGEHFSESQKKHLRENFGVRLIRSATYGTVDIGPLGFQCEHSDGGVHHLQQRLQYLEILKMEEDVPVQGDEVGRLIFTPRILASNKPSRYEIGDVGQWVLDPGGICPCGRSTPRFRLLGRMGDIFRIGSMFLNYHKFVQILSQESAYAGEIQILLTEEKLKEKLVLLASPPLDEKGLKKLCLENYPDLHEASVKDGVLLFETRIVAPAELERTAGSGKLIRILDRRTRG